MIKLGITGGIASGKSTATHYLSKKKLTYIFDADKESKKYLKSSLSTQKNVIELFGGKIIKDHSLDFDLLTYEVFSNKKNQNLLNKLMWPIVHDLIIKEYEIAYNKNYKLFIVDAALIFEASFNSFFNKILLILTNDSIRINRALERKNLSHKTIKDRMKLQMPENSKKQLADIVITNNGNVKELNKKLDQLYKDLLK